MYQAGQCTQVFHDMTDPPHWWADPSLCMVPLLSSRPRTGIFIISWWEVKLKRVKFRPTVMNENHGREKQKRNLKTHHQREESDHETGKGQDWEHHLSGKTQRGEKRIRVKTTTNNLLSTFYIVDTVPTPYAWPELMPKSPLGSRNFYSIHVAGDAVEDERG